MCLIPRNSYNGAFYRAVFALHTENYQLAQQVCILSVLNIFKKIDKIKLFHIIVMAKGIKNTNASYFSALTKPEIFWTQS